MRPPKTQHHHPFEDQAPSWACTLNDNLELVLYKLEMMIIMTKEEIVAALSANTAALETIVVRLDDLDEDSESVAAKLQALKDQIAAGGTGDTSEIEAALAKQSETIDKIRTAVGPAPEPAPTQEPAPAPVD